MLPNNNESFQNRFRSLSEASGGSTVGKSYEGGVVVETKFGEFASQIEPGGELISFFPDKGVLAGYLVDGSLAFVSFDLSVVLENLDDQDLAKMVHGGEDILDLIGELDSHDERLFVSIFPSLGVVKVKLARKEEMVTETEYNYGDFSEERLGRISFGESSVTYIISNEADELQVGFGESEGNRLSMRSISVSHKVNFSPNLLSQDHRQIQSLANQIILND